MLWQDTANKYVMAIETQPTSMLWQDTANKHVMARHSQQACYGKTQPTSMPQWMNQTGVSRSHSRQECCAILREEAHTYIRTATNELQYCTREAVTLVPRSVVKSNANHMPKIESKWCWNELQYCTREAVTLVPRSVVKSNANHMPKTESKWCWWQAGWDATEARPCTRMGRDGVWVGSSWLVLASVALPLSTRQHDRPSPRRGVHQCQMLTFQRQPLESNPLADALCVQQPTPKACSGSFATGRISRGSLVRAVLHRNQTGSG
jgi:hypothetical protein